MVDGYLKPSELLLSFTEFKRLDKSKLNKETLKWLIEWNIHDLAVSPIDDEQRKYIRYGHYLGWC